MVAGRKFATRPEVRGINAWLRCVLNPLDEEASEEVLRQLPRGFGQVACERVRQFAAEHDAGWLPALAPMVEHGVLRTHAQRTAALELNAAYERIRRACDAGATPKEVVRLVVEASGLGACYEHERDEHPEETRRRNAAKALEHLHTLATLAGEHQTLATLAEQLGTGDAGSDEDAPDVVTLSTVHAAKGLEWEHVAVVGLEEGVLPAGWRDAGAPSRARLEEERRVLHVALTRARSSLSLSYARTRFGREQARSRFLIELGLPHDRPTTG